MRSFPMVCDGDGCNSVNYSYNEENTTHHLCKSKKKGKWKEPTSYNYQVGIEFEDLNNRCSHGLLIERCPVHCKKEIKK
jgi:hypothetical protein